MKNKPVKGDWIKLVERDFESINETIDEDQIENQTEKEYKKKIKSNNTSPKKHPPDPWSRITQYHIDVSPSSVWLLFLCGKDGKGGRQMMTISKHATELLYICIVLYVHVLPVLSPTIRRSQNNI